jgi:hypothetical protein
MNGDISNELRSTISTLAVIQSCATDPGHVLTITGAQLNWTIGGLVAKYGYQFNGLAHDIVKLIEDYKLIGDDNNQVPVTMHDEPLDSDNLNYNWDMAIDYYNSSRQHWGVSMKMCRRIAQHLISISVVEDMFDYKIMATNFMDEMKSMRVSRLEEDE